MKKPLKIAALVLALVLLAGLAWFANGLVGNPLSRFLAKRGAEQYLQEHYGREDLSISNFGFSFKSADYYARVKSDTSVDTDFFIYLDWFGRVIRDAYDSYVTSGRNTADRLGRAYRALGDPILQDDAFPYGFDFGSNQLEVLWAEGEEGEYGFGLPMWELELDKEYDVRELGREYGVLCVYIRDPDVTVERAAEIALGLRRLFDEANIPFRVLDLCIRLPREDIQEDSADPIYALLDYDEIVEEGLTERIEASHQAKMDYFAAMDKENEAWLATLETEGE